MSNKISNHHMRAQCPIDGSAETIMKLVKPLLSKKLFEDMRDYLLGFTNDIQLEIADNFLDAACHGWKHYVGIRHIDQKLKIFYLLIDVERGRN